MIYSKVSLRFHWGFSVVKPGIAKAKQGFYLPPPTTLIGALSYGEFRGFDTIKFNQILGSPAYGYYGKVIAASKLVSEATYTEDIIKNVISYFQRKERWTDPKYIYGAVPTGKVYMPNGDIIAIYLTNSLSKEKLEKLSWSITRIGCKECLVSVESVEIGEATKVTGNVKTSFYFPASVKIVGSKGFTEYANFWDQNGYLWSKEGSLIKYILPIRLYPLASREVEVEAKEAYEVDGEYVVFG